MMSTDLKNTGSIAELICILTRHCNTKEEYFASTFNLSPSEVRVLKFFMCSPALSVKELGNLLKLSPGRITQIVSSLEKKKLVTRTVDTNDKRNVIVSIQQKGFPFISNINESYAKLNARIFGSVTAEKQAEIISSLKVLVELLSVWAEEDNV